MSWEINLKFAPVSVGAIHNQGGTEGQKCPLGMEHHRGEQRGTIYLSFFHKGNIAYRD
jgi:hypothetical protein